MLDKIIEKFKNKNIAILGFGREGRSTYKFLRSNLKDEKITILDKNNTIKDDEIFKIDQNIEFILGDNYLNNLDNFDIIVKTPGISLHNIDTTKIINKIVSQCSLLLECTDFKTIAVTGTKGKSTTSTLIYEVIKAQNDNVFLMGNIGIPIFDYIDNFNKDSILVLELSAYQLEYIKKSPHISILLNLYQEHLDYFKTLDNYYNSKLNILRNQNENDYGFYLYDNNKYIDNKIKSKLFAINKDIYIKDNYIYFNKEKLYNINEKRNLLGEHNLVNIMFVLGVSYILKLNMNKVIETINNFKGLEHRMELVGTYDNITFYNDTIATIPEATINCIKALKEVDTLILGGMDRGIDYNNFIKELNSLNIKNFICMPDTGNKIGKQLINKNVYYEENMEKVVKLAKKITAKGKICLLSPAAPSYNKYKNFEEKGKLYKEYVRNK